MSAPNAYRLIKADAPMKLFVSRLPDNVTVGDLKSSCQMGRVVPEVDPENPNPPTAQKEHPFSLLANNVKYLIGKEESLDTYCHFIIEDAGNKCGTVYPVSKMFTFLQTAQPSTKEEPVEGVVEDKLQEAMTRRLKENKKAALIAQKAASLMQKPLDEQTAGVKRDLDVDDDEGVDAFDDDDGAVKNFKDKKMAFRIKRQRKGKDALLDETDPEGALAVKAFRKRDNDWDCDDDFRSDDDEDFAAKAEDDEEAEAVLAAAEKDKPKDDAGSDSESDEEGEGDEDGKTLAPLGKEMRELCETMEQKARDAELDAISSEEEDDDEDGSEADGNEEERGGADADKPEDEDGAPPVDILQKTEEAALKMARNREQSDAVIWERKIIREFQKAGGRLTTKELLARLNLTTTDTKILEMVKKILMKVVNSVTDDQGNKSLVLKIEFT
eukprot:GDKK01060224.1.p1 GENE.GDKK01060224.1~~GDKK01060224.1.p1  ORF type:complete len:454 (-),score=152.29 GDKK01060224.1:74-1396(-)